MSAMDMPHVVDVHNFVNSRDRYGGLSNYQVVAYADEPAWVQPASAKDVVEYERRGVVITHVVYFLRNLALTTEHRIVHDGKSYIVTGFQDASAGLSVLWKAIVSHNVDGLK